MDEKEIINAYNEGLNAVIRLVQDIHMSLSGQIGILNQRITELEARLNKNSDNSSKPPSSDGYRKPQNSRQKTGKAKGHMKLQSIHILLT